VLSVAVSDHTRPPREIHDFRSTRVGTAVAMAARVTHGPTHSDGPRRAHPGRYLAVCTFLPHFLDKMFGFIRVVK
jgi:hypothetical protein